MEYIASLSYGKDSIYMLEVIKQNGLPLDRIVHAEIMATDTIPADLPPMMEFKKEADKIIKERYGIEVEHIHATVSYEEQFYTKYGRGKKIGNIYGFPCMLGTWCNSRLKMSVLNKFNKKNIIQYIGLAVEEVNRYHILNERKTSPLVDFNITEKQCYKWCEENNLLSPIYKNAARGGCWFCHNQSISQLRFLRKNYKEYWKLMLKWDNDSLITFKANGTTIHDIELRFQAEDNQLKLF